MKKIKALLLSLALVIFASAPISAKADGEITAILEQQEAQTDNITTDIRYVCTISNLTNLNDITSIDLNLTMYKYGKQIQTATESTTKVYSSVANSTYTAKANTYYAVFTLNNADSFNNYTLSTKIGLNMADSTIKYSNEISYTINDSGDTFIKCMDASAVPALESVGVEYYNYNSETSEDVYKILADNGVNYIRVRIWNDPYDSNGHGYGGGNCDLANAIAIGKRANKYGMKLLANFQYSDFWADPGKQILPKAWASYSTSQIQSAIYNYTKDSLNTMKDAGIDIGMVQVGNETNDSMCGLMGEEGSMSTICSFMAKGSQAVREVYPNALVALHFANPSNTGNYNWYASELNKANVDYDVFGTSYYPYWHGTKTNLSSILNTIATTYNKKVMILETSYANCEMDGNSTNSDGYNNTVYTKSYVISQNGSNADLPYDFTVAGQKNQITDLMDLVANIKTSTKQYGIGVAYWEGTWISTKRFATSALPLSTIWNEYGTGWAATYANDYYQNFANTHSAWLSTSGQSASDYSITSAGGCVIENEAFFDEYGHAYASIEAFKHTVSATANVLDPLPADANLANLLYNGDFETTQTDGSYTWPDLTKWDISKTGSNAWASQSDWIKNGNYSFGFGDNSEAYTGSISQTLTGGEGTYKLSVSFAGKWTGSESTATLFVTVNGARKVSKSMSITANETLQSFTTDSFTVSASDTVIIGVEISGVQWWDCYIDDFKLIKQ